MVDMVGLSGKVVDCIQLQMCVKFGVSWTKGVGFIFCVCVCDLLLQHHHLADRSKGPCLSSGGQ